MSKRPSVDDIVEQVQECIDDGQIDRMDSIAMRLVDAEAEVTRFLGDIRERRHMMFYFNTSSIGGGNSSISLSVRVHGIQCGQVELTGSKDRPFTPLNLEIFQGCWEASDATSLQWTDRPVRRYLECAERVARTSGMATREAAVQAATIRSIKTSGEWDFQALVAYPARTSMGLPYQLPVPIRARGGARALVGRGAGHIDLLTRVSQPEHRLRVLELKRPTATDVSTSLEQAVAYAAALRIQMSQGTWYPRLIGYSNAPPPLEATAVVADTEEARAEIRDSLEGLIQSTERFRELSLSALFYRWVPAPSGLITVTHDLGWPE
jgi:hypothetical protein